MNYMKDKDDLLLSILQSPVNVFSTQNLVNKKEKDRQPEEKVSNDPYKVDISFGKAKEVDEKYIERMAKKMQEAPDEVMIDTPRGPMTVADAIKAGFNLETGEFEDEMLPPNMEDFGMDEATMEQLMMLMQDPNGAPQGPPAPQAAPGRAMPPEMMEEEMMTEEGMEEEMLAELMGEEEALI